MEQETAASSEVTPPSLEPLRRAEDRSGRRCQGGPLPTDRIERSDLLDPKLPAHPLASLPVGAGAATTSFMTSKSDLLSASPSRRISRLVARTLGVPVAVALVWALRLSNRKAG